LKYIYLIDKQTCLYDRSNTELRLFEDII